MKKIILFFLILVANFEHAKAQLVDIDGNIYNTDRIGGYQSIWYSASIDGEDNVEVLRDSFLIWTVANLNVSKFKNGEVIIEAKSSAEWEDALNKGIPAWCYVGNDPSTGKTLGKLYNYYAVTSLKGLAPDGWHISSDFEWEMFNKYHNVKITEANSYEDYKIFMNPSWKSPYSWGYGTNKTGFNALPSGYRSISGFTNDGAYYWSDIALDRRGEPFHVILGDNYMCTDSGCEWTYYAGFSVRCVKDW